MPSVKRGVSAPKIRRVKEFDWEGMDETTRTEAVDALMRLRAAVQRHAAVTTALRGALMRGNQQVAGGRILELAGEALEVAAELGGLAQENFGELPESAVAALWDLSGQIDQAALR